MFNFYSIPNQNTTTKPNLLSTPSRETSPTSEGITEESSITSPVTATNSTTPPIATSHNPYPDMLDNSSQQIMNSSTLEPISPTKTTPRKETLKERINLTKGTLTKRNLEYIQQQALKQRLLNVQPEILIDSDVKMAQISETPKLPIPGILPTPTIQLPHFTPSQIFSQNKTTSEVHMLRFHHFKNQTIREQQPQQENQVQVHHSKKPMIKLTPQEALKILQQYNYFTENSHVVISQNQLATSTNTKNPTRYKR